MKISAALQTISTLYVEAAPFIYLAESRAGYMDKMRDIFKRVGDGRLTIASSVITVTECLNKPLHANDSRLIQTFMTLFDSTIGLHLFPVDRPIAFRAAALRATYNLRMPDALHVATAIAAGCDAFLTNDFGLKRVNDLPILVFDELDML